MPPLPPLITLTVPTALIINPNLSAPAVHTWMQLRCLAGEADQTPPLTYPQAARRLGKSVSALYNHLHQLRGCGLLETRLVEEGTFIASFACIEDPASAPGQVPGTPAELPAEAAEDDPALETPNPPVVQQPDSMRPISRNRNPGLASVELPPVPFPLSPVQESLAPDSRNPIFRNPNSKNPNSALTLNTTILNLIVKHDGIGSGSVNGGNSDFRIPGIRTGHPP